MKKLAKSVSLLLALLLAACGALAESGESYPIESPYTGLRVTVDAEHADLGIVGGESLDAMGNVCFDLYFAYMPALEALEQQLDAVLESGDQDQLNALVEEYYQHVVWLASVSLLDKADSDAQLAAGTTLAEQIGAEEAETFGENGEYAYALQTIAAEPTESMDEEEIAQLNAAAAYVPELLKTVEFIDVEPLPEEGKITEIAPFTTTDLDGNEVTNAIFGEKDLTVVNFWGTFCGPCINEMPELGEWSRSMPENVQIIGVLVDVNSADDEDGVAAARQIVADTGADYPQLIGNEDFNMLASVSAVPTTIFVDREGNVVGGTVVGADVAQYKAFVEEYLLEKE